jgi:xanthine/uracil/vitamin C permease (AzgA family)
MADDRDEFIERTEEAEEEQHPVPRAGMFDLRRLIGGLFVVYGVLVGVAGLFDSGAEISKAQGVRVNLWTGLGMLVVGLFFLIWQWLRPLDTGRGGGGGGGRRPEGGLT